MKFFCSVLVCSGIILSMFSGLNGEPIIGSSALTLSKGSFVIESHFGYTGYNAQYYLAQEEWIGFDEGESNTVMLLLPQFHYGVFDFLNVRFSLPLVMHKVDFGTELSSSGIGDLFFDFKHCVYSGGQGMPSVSWRGGGRFPTGDKEADVPLGDGSMDFLAELLITEALPWFTLHANLGYWYNGEVDNVDLDDQITYTAGVEYPFGFQSALLVETSGFVAGSGETQYYLWEVCPGISSNAIRHLALEASVKIPIKARGGLRYGFSPFVGFLYHF